MSSKVQKLLTLATNFEKLAVDIIQPPDFEEDWKKWKELKEPKPATEEDAYQKWLKDNFDPLEEEIEVEELPQVKKDIPHELKADTYIRTADRYEAISNKLLAEAMDKHENFMRWLEEQYGYDHEQYSKLEPGAKKHLHEMYEHDNKETKKEASKKDKKKLDPKAKVRNRGKVIFPAERSKDHKDHFEINNIGQARNALARSMQYNKAPPWYSGSLQGLQEAVRRAVKKHYPSIEVSEGKKKKSSAIEISAELLSKYG